MEGIPKERIIIERVKVWKDGFEQLKWISEHKRPSWTPKRETAHACEERIIEGLLR